jgi:hypothetical protein
VGITEDLDAFAWTTDGALLLSLQKAVNVPGVGEVDDSDLLRFTPTTLGANTVGAFTLYFDGSDVGLKDDGEDVDALSLLADGRLVISTKGTFEVNDLEVKKEDLLLFAPTTLGETTVGAWALYFDGSDLEEPDMGKDLWGVWIDATGQVYLSTESSILGDDDDDSVDLFRCQPTALGNDTACTLTSFWNGDGNGYGDEDERIDGVDFGPAWPTMAAALAAGNATAALDSPEDPTVAAAADYDLEDYAEEDLQHFYLPLVTNQ